MAGLSADISDLVFSVSGLAGKQVIAEVPRLCLPAGQLTVVTGPSGSGKSTLLHLLAGLLAPQRGKIAWGDIDLARQPESARDRWRLAHAGFVFQSFNLIDELSPVENVLLPVWFANLGARDRRARAEGLLDELGVPAQRRHVSLLSRGEQQRVAIARALLLDPQVIFADEPTASLDASAGVWVAQALHRLAIEQGRTVVVASHDPAMIDRASQLVSIDHGRATAKEALAG